MCPSQKEPCHGGVKITDNLIEAAYTDEVVYARNTDGLEFENNTVYGSFENIRLTLKNVKNASVRGNITVKNGGNEKSSHRYGCVVYLPNLRFCRGEGARCIRKYIC